MVDAGSCCRREVSNPLPGACWFCGHGSYAHPIRTHRSLRVSRPFLPLAHTPALCGLFLRPRPVKPAPGNFSRSSAFQAG